MIKSKTKKTIYITFFFVVAFTLSLGSAIVADKKFTFDALGVGFIAFYVLILALLIYWLYTQLTTITIDKNAISFKKPFSRSVKINFQEISAIKFTGKVRNKFIFSPDMDGTKIKLINGREFCFEDGIYTNIGDLKSALKNFVIEKKLDYVPLVENKFQPDVQLDDAQVFNGKVSFREVTFWVFATFIAVFFIKHPENLKPLRVLSFVFLFWFLFTSYTLNYFAVTNTYLVIKNRYFFWIKRIFLLTDIEEVVIDENYRSPKYLKIIMKSFTNKLFYGASLRKSDWLQLKRTLEMRGVKVRNECIAQ